jgi:hypothetical protein
MPTLFERLTDHSEPDDAKELFFHKLLHDAGSQISPERLKSNHDLLDALTDAAVRGQVDDKEYVVRAAVPCHVLGHH